MQVRLTRRTTHIISSSRMIHCRRLLHANYQTDYIVWQVCRDRWSISSINSAIIATGKWYELLQFMRSKLSVVQLQWIISTATIELTFFDHPMLIYYFKTSIYIHNWVIFMGKTPKNNELKSSKTAIHVCNTALCDFVIALKLVPWMELIGHWSVNGLLGWKSRVFFGYYRHALKEITLRLTLWIWRNR